MKKDILQMNKAELLELNPRQVTEELTPEAILHMARELGALWEYNREAAEQDLVGRHARLKSGRHSDSFFHSGFLLAPENIRRIISAQMVLKLLKELNEGAMWWPSHIVGVPNGAAQLGKDVARMLEVTALRMEKIDGKITLISPIPKNSRVLVLDDACTRGTGFKETVAEIVAVQPLSQFVHLNPVIINRGGLKEVEIEVMEPFRILSLVEHRIQDWPADECPLCAIGSEPTAPKAIDDGWWLLTTSQQV